MSNSYQVRMHVAILTGRKPKGKNPDAAPKLPKTVMPTRWDVWGRSPVNLSDRWVPAVIH
jgi:hypothetical protein